MVADYVQNSNKSNLPYTRTSPRISIPKSNKSCKRPSTTPTPSRKQPRKQMRKLKLKRLPPMEAKLPLLSSI